jgi:hypothetical protein
VGEGARRNVAVDVEFKPSITVPRPRPSQAPGYDMDLECHVEAYPPPAITWHKDGFQLSNNQFYRISQFSTESDSTSATLRVFNLDYNRYGRYRCQAANKFGRAEGAIELVGKFFGPLGLWIRRRLISTKRITDYSNEF